MTAEQARERADRLLDTEIKADPVTELRDAFARGLLLAQAEVLEDTYRRCLSSEKRMELAAELRRVAEGV